MKNTRGLAYVVPSVYKKRERERDREQRKNRTQLYVYNFTKGLFFERYLLSFLLLISTCYSPLISTMVRLFLISLSDPVSKLEINLNTLT
jgi:hypothetical protein